MPRRHGRIPEQREHDICKFCTENGKRYMGTGSVRCGCLDERDAGAALAFALSSRAHRRAMRDAKGNAMIKPGTRDLPRRRPRCRGKNRLVVCLSASLALWAAHEPAAWAGDAVETSGDLLRLALPAAALALTIKRHDRDGRRQFYKAFGANVAATWVLKEAIDKKRPDGQGHDAFPSGHSSMAFQGAAFIHRRYGFRSAWPAYLLATYTGWTRIDADEHDESDVLAGAALGIASSFFFAERLPRVNVAATIDHGAVGLRVSGHF
jgi:hypothetical protein